jgi:molybdopterin molybdotransferase
MLEVEQAQQRILSTIEPLASESLSLRDAAGRVLARPTTAPISLPRFDNSAMDGYAVCAADVAGASADSPVPLRNLGAVAAGSALVPRVEPKTCVRVFTGSPLPVGADAVVMQEDTRVAGDLIEVLDAVRPWESVRLAGEDVKQDTVIAQPGERISAARLALLGAMGIECLAVTRQPLIGILSTGNELVEAGRPLAPGEIYESNRAAIASLVVQAGGLARVLPLVRDTLAETRMALELAFAECDAVVTTGGASVGEHDFVKAAFESMGGLVEFWKVAMKPGKPFVFGRWQTKSLFGLPGNPVSAFVTFLLLVRPAILKMQGVAGGALPAHLATLAEEIHNRGDRRHFMRVVVDGRGNVRSAGLQASHALNSLAAANALLAVPPNTLWPAGRTVEVLRWEV